MHRHAALVLCALLAGCGSGRLSEPECRQLIERQIGFTLAAASPETDVDALLGAADARSYENACDAFGKDARTMYECAMAAGTKGDMDRCMIERIAGVKI
jgi:hypothetical protein